MPKYGHILVVDDSETNRTLEKLLLESEGYEVTLATGGADAWGWLQEHDVDVVVTDLDMPGMDGMALTEAIRGSTRLRALPVVVMSGMDEQDQETRVLRGGANVYLGKGTADIDRLVEVLGQLV